MERLILLRDIAKGGGKVAAFFKNMKTGQEEELFEKLPQVGAILPGPGILDTIFPDFMNLLIALRLRE